MVFYLDSSVLLRVLFKEATALKEFTRIEEAISSELLRVECLRTIDRIRIEQKLSEDEYVVRASLLHTFLSKVEFIPLAKEILNRASQPFPTILGSLDAIHLSSLVLYRERVASEVTLCTHDSSLGRAASALNVPVLGL